VLLCITLVSPQQQQNFNFYRCYILSAPYSRYWHAYINYLLTSTSSNTSTSTTTSTFTSTSITTNTFTSTNPFTSISTSTTTNTFTSTNPFTSISTSTTTITFTSTNTSTYTLDFTVLHFQLNSFILSFITYIHT